jgi:3-keto-disaccharide hydrolase
MKTLLKSAAFICLSLLVLSCNTERKIELFNGQDLDNWNIIVDSEDGEPLDLFYVEDGVLNTLGVPFGYIRTKESYSSYKLHLEWRWIEEPSNSGVLINVQGKEIIFPQCVECQLMNGKAGDIVLMGKGTGITVKDSTYTVASEQNRYLVIPKFEESSENAAGEWNSYDITSKDGNLEVYVNGILQNKASGMTLTEGNIALQSEGAPLQFRNIYLQAL